MRGNREQEEDGRIGCADRAGALRAEPATQSQAKPLVPLRERLRNWWRKQKRAPYYTDLRLIALEHRHIYRDGLRRAGNCGTALGLLFEAQRRKHLISQRGEHR